MLTKYTIYVFIYNITESQQNFISQTEKKYNFPFPFKCTCAFKEKKKKTEDNHLLCFYSEGQSWDLDDDEAGWDLYKNKMLFYYTVHGIRNKL